MYSTTGSQYLVIEKCTFSYKKYVLSIPTMIETFVSIFYIDEQCKNYSELEQIIISEML